MRADFKSGFVTLIGRPNVGKSTLMNYLIGQKIAITSNKPQTTRNRIQTVLTTDEGQIVFVDTPGIHKAKNKLGTYMVNVAELIREKALHCLNEEIPHGIAVSIEKMKARKKVMDIEATIICERDSHKGIIIGKQGSMLKKIGSTARYEIEQMLECKVNLQLWVKVKKDWRDSDFLIKNFGYREDE